MKNDGNRRRTATKGQQVGRPDARTAMERAERIANDRDGMRAMYERACELEARFRDATEQDVIAMWKAGRNEKGQPLDAFELEALSERWYTLFGFAPPFDAVEGDSAKAPDDEPADDTMIHIPEVVRRTGVSQSQLKRMQQEGLFPAATRIGKRRIGWPAGEIKAWLAERPRQRVIRRRVR
jgi:prophage regulatory protein